jgi:hypothetical protein
LGDRLGHRRVMQLAGALWIAALGTLLVVTLTQAAWLLYVVFALLGSSNAGGVVSDFNLAMEFGPEAERPTYVGPHLDPARAADRAADRRAHRAVDRYPALFATSLFFALSGLYLLSARQEPRHWRKSNRCDRAGSVNLQPASSRQGARLLQRASRLGNAPRILKFPPDRKSPIYKSLGSKPRCEATAMAAARESTPNLL